MDIIFKTKLPEWFGSPQSQSGKINDYFDRHEQPIRSQCDGIEMIYIVEGVPGDEMDEIIAILKDTHFAEFGMEMA